MRKRIWRYVFRSAVTGEFISKWLADKTPPLTIKHKWRVVEQPRSKLGAWIQVRPLKRKR